MFELFKKEKKEVKELYSPVNGKMIKIEEVPDCVFASKMMGNGVAFNFNDGFIYAPCDCEIVLIANTKHAIGLKTVNGIEILIHIGLETVNLKGEGFKHLKNVGDKVRKGEKLVEVDVDFMKRKGMNLITPMVITSNQEIEICDVEDVDNKTVVIKIK
jgi:sugar PTS system EIIA component